MHRFGLTAICLMLGLALACGSQTTDQSAVTPATRAAAEAANNSSATPPPEAAAPATAAVAPDVNALAALTGAATETHYTPPMPTPALETVYIPPKWTPPPLEKRDVEVTTDGIKISGLFVRPLGMTPVGRIVALHGMDGLDAAARREAVVLAQSGYLVLALDYYGKVPASRAESAKLEAQLDQTEVFKRIAAAAGWLAAQAADEVSFPPVVVGWASGGRLALGAAQAANPPRAVVTYYGDLPPVEAAPAMAKSKTAIFGVFAREDAWVTPARVDAFDIALSQAGVDHQFVSYNTQPGFIEAPRNRADEDYGREARRAMRDFLARRNLAKPR